MYLWTIENIIPKINPEKAYTIIWVNVILVYGYKSKSDIILLWIYFIGTNEISQKKPEYNANFLKTINFFLNNLREKS
ncbi:MAG: hypothetical protein N3F64_04950 [Nitrososphaeria archaeon]|nr:hypothetical protein [Nitrososphaeria archaeon]